MRFSGAAVVRASQKIGGRLAQDLDCVITDIGMPSMNGFDLHDAIKGKRPDVPVFLLTGRHEIGDQQRAARDGIAGFFYKPFDGPALLAAVAHVLSKPSKG